MFFMRIEFDMASLDRRLPQMEEDFRLIAEDFKMEWRFSRVSQKKRLAILYRRRIIALSSCSGSGRLAIWTLTSRWL